MSLNLVPYGTIFFLMPVNLFNVSDTPIGVTDKVGLDARDKFPKLIALFQVWIPLSVSRL
ncbi:MAG: hypothetical protein ACSLEL_01110 [Candidatus Malihini olakiniferum]